MSGTVFYTAGHTDALKFAAKKLQEKGFPFANTPDENVTHILLGVPFTPQQGDDSLSKILSQVPKDVTIIGGNLGLPELAEYHTIDLLKDPLYLAQNANITAHCAIKQALNRLSVTLDRCPVLVIGWGRIGKCLATLLKQMGAIVTVAARKETDRAALESLGYETEDSTNLNYSLIRYRVIFNTVPNTVLSQDAAEFCHKDCLKIDLASKLGIEADDVVWARGLPNKDAPESSGALIASTILRLIRQTK